MGGHHTCDSSPGWMTGTITSSLHHEYWPLLRGRCRLCLLLLCASFMGAAAAAASFWPLPFAESCELQLCALHWWRRCCGCCCCCCCCCCCGLAPCGGCHA